MLLPGENMKIKANDYRANEIIKIIREWSGKTHIPLSLSIFPTPL